MPMEMSITLKQIYIKIIYSFIQPMLLSITHVYFSRWGSLIIQGWSLLWNILAPFLILSFSSNWYVQHSELLYLEGWKYLVFTVLLLINYIKLLNYICLYIYVSKYICICKYTYITNEEAHQEMLSSMKK